MSDKPGVQLPLEVKRRRGRTPTTDSGGRPLPEPVVYLPTSTSTPEPPGTLGDAGREAWERLWTNGRHWLSTQLHLDILTRLCEAHDERLAIRAQIVRDGMTQDGCKGQPVPHPLFGRLAVVEDTMTKLETLCGFNPAAMSKLGYAEIKAASELDKMTARRRGRAG